MRDACPVETSVGGAVGVRVTGGSRGEMGRNGRVVLEQVTGGPHLGIIATQPAVQHTCTPGFTWTHSTTVYIAGTRNTEHKYVRQGSPVHILHTG